MDAHRTRQAGIHSRLRVSHICAHLGAAPLCWHQYCATTLAIIGSARKRTTRDTSKAAQRPRGTSQYFDPPFARDTRDHSSLHQRHPHPQACHPIPFARQQRRTDTRERGDPPLRMGTFPRAQPSRPARQIQRRHIQRVQVPTMRRRDNGSWPPLHAAGMLAGSPCRLCAALAQLQPPPHPATYRESERSRSDTTRVRLTEDS
jgi:hypothetical protein